MNYFRCNNAGYGVRHDNKPALAAQTSLKGTTDITKWVKVLKDSDVLRVSLGCLPTVKAISFDLRDIQGAESIPFTATSRSSPFTINIGGVFGEVWRVNANNILQLLLDNETVKVPITSLRKLSLYRTTSVELFNTRTYTTATTRIRALLAENDGNIDLTWYQLQYAVLQTEAPYYVDNDTAETWVRQYDALAAVADEYM